MFPNTLTCGLPSRLKKHNKPEELFFTSDKYQYAPVICQYVFRFVHAEKHSKGEKIMEVLSD
jgi:hypothetical protein